jgi:hypothetical protein
MPAALIAAGGSLLGGLLQSRSAKKAAQIQADAQVKAAQIAAEEARFRPVGVTTRFGQSQFQTDPTTGRVSGAGYELSPELKAMQDRFLGLTGGGLMQAEQAQQQFAPLQGAAQGLFGLGQQYLAQSPQEAAQQYMAQQQELLAPSRERQYGALQNQLFQTGRGGLSVGATGARPSGAAGLGASTPETEAYYNALAQQDAALAAQAMQAGQQQTAFGAGLFGTGGNLLTQGYGGQVAALGPYEAYLQQMKSLESLGQQPLQLGIDIGAKGQSNAAAQAMLSTSPSRQSYEANAFNPFAESLMAAGRNPAFQRGVQPYASALGQSAIYGNQNVYGFGGGGTVPTQFSLFGEY